MPPEPDGRESDEAMDARARALGARLDDDDVARVEPPASVWTGIAAQLDGQQQPTTVADPPPIVLATRRRPVWQLAAAAAVVVALIVAGVVLATRDSGPSTRTIARASLEVLEGTATADARLVEEDGHQVLVIDAEGMPAAPAGSHFELWLLDPDGQDPRSLGPMTGSTRITVPPTINTATHDVVDISLQANGQREHSGHSLLRGALS